VSLTRHEITEAVHWAEGLAYVLARLGGQLHRVDDAVSAARGGLADAIGGFDETLGDPEVPPLVKLKTYAKRRVVGEILDALEAGRRSDAFELALDDGLDDPEGPEEAVDGYVLACAAEELRCGGQAGLLRHEAHERLRAEIDRLPPEDRRLLELRFWEEQRWKGVARALGVAEPTARDHWRKLRDRLRTALLAHDADPPPAPGGRVVPLSRPPRTQG
jgi:RNA polymerase sigma factor (sigma-70 family)